MKKIEAKIFGFDEAVFWGSSKKWGISYGLHTCYTLFTCMLTLQSFKF